MRQKFGRIIRCKALAKDAAGLVVSTYAIWCVDAGSADIAAAFRIEDEAQIGFWDALIVASAVKAGAKRLLSEDLNAGQTIAGVVIENPFERRDLPRER